MKQPQIPSIEEIIEAGAFEARAHLLTDDERYFTQPFMVPQPTPDAVNQQLPNYSDIGQTLWVDFFSYDVGHEIETSYGARYSITRKGIGDIAVATHFDKFEAYQDVVQHDVLTDFIKSWLQRYASDTSRNSFGAPRHPTESIHALYLHEDLVEG